MTDRYDSLMPRDLLITLRSLPRRFDTIHNSATKTPQMIALIDQAGPTGQSLGNLVNEAVRVLSATDPAVAILLTANSPDIAIYELGSAQDDERLSIKDAVAVLSSEATSIADQLDNVSADDWNRPATVSGAESTTLVDLVRCCVRSSVEVLRSAERQVEWMQAQ